MKSLYGLKQGPRNWHKLVVDQIKLIGFKQCVIDKCLIEKNIGKEIYPISLYVDVDILIAETGLQEVKRIKQTLTNHFEIKDMGELI